MLEKIDCYNPSISSGEEGGELRKNRVQFHVKEEQVVEQAIDSLVHFNNQVPSDDDDVDVATNIVGKDDDLSNSCKGTLNLQSNNSESSCTVNNKNSLVSANEHCISTRADSHHTHCCYPTHDNKSLQENPTLSQNTGETRQDKHVTRKTAGIRNEEKVKVSDEEKVLPLPSFCLVSASTVEGDHEKSRENRQSSNSCSTTTADFSSKTLPSLEIFPSSSSQSQPPMIHCCSCDPTNKSIHHCTEFCCEEGSKKDCSSCKKYHNPNKPTFIDCSSSSGDNRQHKNKLDNSGHHDVFSTENKSSSLTQLPGSDVAGETSTNNAFLVLISENNRNLGN